MSHSTKSPVFSLPVAIGGIGGSGTRVVARMLMECGIFMGGDLNSANDNLWFSLLFRRDEIFSESPEQLASLSSVFVKAMCSVPLSGTEITLVRQLASTPRPELPTRWLRQRADSLQASTRSSPNKGPWGWKEPNTHIVIHQLLHTIPGLRYIHVIRNGLDMAYSANQNQLQLWGRHLLGEECPTGPRCALRFWHRANRRVIELLADTPDRFLLLDFDRLCLEPTEEIGRLIAFLDVRDHIADIQHLKSLLRVPSSIGRFKAHSAADFSDEDIRYVRALGFDTTY